MSYRCVVYLSCRVNSGKRPKNRGNAPKKYGNPPKIDGNQPIYRGKPCKRATFSFQLKEHIFITKDRIIQANLKYSYEKTMKLIETGLFLSKNKIIY